MTLYITQNAQQMSSTFKKEEYIVKLNLIKEAEKRD